MNIREILDPGIDTSSEVMDSINEYDIGGESGE